jgi:hypothetical protein
MWFEVEIGVDRDRFQHPPGLCGLAIKFGN